MKARFGLHDRWRLQQASVCPTEGNEHGELSARVFDSDSQVIIAIVANALSIVNKLSLTQHVYALVEEHVEPFQHYALQ